MRVSEERETVTITVNGEPVVAEKGELVIAAAERAGTYIPHFCYHPRMASVGMCRMCIVDIDTGRGPALQPACMIEVAPDMVVDTHSEATKKAQDGVLEFLLINHPLDCPVCDKGGECPLQDQTIAYGPGESRFVEEKRHYAKPIPVNDVVLLDRERCILCDRCTRFAKDVAGDPLISFIGRGAATQVNTFPDHPFSSYFSGNTVQICPVGALTAGPFRFRARPWDLANAESTCTTCSVGCRVAIQSSRDEVLRYSGVDVDPVNWGWLCDKGRFDFSYVNNPDRLGEPLVRTPGGSGLTTARWSEALGRAAEALEAAPADRIGVIGGARLTNESAYAWAKLAKGVLGTDNVDAQLGDGLPADLVLGLPRATIDEACAPGTTAVLLGPDIKEELGVLYLRLRHAAVEDGVRIIEIAPATSGLTPYATHTELHAPGGAPAAVASVLDAGLLGDGPVVVLLGRPSLAEPAAHTARAALDLAEVGDRVRFLSTLRRGNVHGALDMGLAPGVLPGRAPLDGGGEALADVWPTVPASVGLDTDAMLQGAADGGLDVLVLLGADPVQDAPDRDLARRALEAVGTVIAVDCFLTGSVEAADVVLPAAGYAEVDGTTTNLEGRVSTVAQRVTSPGAARADWIIATDLAARLGSDLGVTSVEDLLAEIERVAPTHAGLGDRLVAAGGDGVLVEGSSVTAGAVTDGHLPAADSYSLRLASGRTMYDEATLVQRASTIAKLARPATVRLNPHDFDRLGIETGTPVKVTSARGSITVSASADAGVPRASAVVPFNAPGGAGGDLISAGEAVTDVRVERL
ncbi:MAG: NADH-quinone oxidoreductase subunit NuoG [Acidimicrobiales bacterium]